MLFLINKFKNTRGVFFIDFDCEWFQLKDIFDKHVKYNWFSFTFLTLDFEYIEITKTIALTFGILGFAISIGFGNYENYL